MPKLPFPTVKPLPILYKKKALGKKVILFYDYKYLKNGYEMHKNKMLLVSLTTGLASGSPGACGIVEE